MTDHRPVARRQLWQGLAAIPILVFASCGLWYYSVTSQVIEDYRPAYQVESLTSDSLARSQVSFRHNSVTVILNWSTFGNDRFGRGPYKLRIVVRPEAPNFEALVVDSIRIESDRGLYQLSTSIAWPVRIPRAPTAWSDHIFEPALSFDYDGGETVTTRLWYSVENTFDSLPQVVELRWVPVRIKQFVPIA